MYVDACVHVSDDKRVTVWETIDKVDEPYALMIDDEWHPELFDSIPEALTAAADIVGG